MKSFIKFSKNFKANKHNINVQELNLLDINLNNNIPFMPNTILSNIVVNLRENYNNDNITSIVCKQPQQMPMHVHIMPHEHGAFICEIANLIKNNKNIKSVSLDNLQPNNLKTWDLFFDAVKNCESIETINLTNCTINSSIYNLHTIKKFNLQNVNIGGTINLKLLENNNQDCQIECNVQENDLDQNEELKLDKIYNGNCLEQVIEASAFNKGGIQKINFSNSPIHIEHCQPMVLLIGDLVNKNKATLKSVVINGIHNNCKWENFFDAINICPSLKELKLDSCNLENNDLYQIKNINICELSLINYNFNSKTDLKILVGNNPKVKFLDFGHAPNIFDPKCAIELMLNKNICIKFDNLLIPAGINTSNLYKDIFGQKFCQMVEDKEVLLLNCFKEWGKTHHTKFPKPLQKYILELIFLTDPSEEFNTLKLLGYQNDDCNDDNQSDNI